MNQNGVCNIEKSRVTNLVEEIKDDLACQACGKIVLKATCCKHCESTYCVLCAWLLVKDSCPCTNCKRGFEEKVAPKIVTNMIGRLRIACKNRSLGCEDTFEPDSLSIHEVNDCPFTTVYCGNQFCKEKILKKDIASHVCVMEKRNPKQEVGVLEPERSLIQPSPARRSFGLSALEASDGLSDLREIIRKLERERLEMNAAVAMLSEKLKEKDDTIQLLSENHLRAVKRIESLELRLDMIEGVQKVRKDSSQTAEENKFPKFYNFSHWALKTPKKSDGSFPEFVLSTYAKVNVGGQVEKITYFLPLNKTLLLLLIDAKRFSCWNTYGDCEVPHYLDIKKEPANVNFTSFNLFSLRGQTVESLFYKELSWESSWALSEFGYLLIIAEDIYSDIYLYDLEYKAEKRCIFFLEKVFLQQEDPLPAPLLNLRNLSTPMVVEDIGNSTHIISTGVSRQPAADTIKIWDCVQTHNTVTIIKMAHSSNIFDIKVVERGRTFASAGEDCTVKIWEIIHNTFEKIVSVRSKFVINTDQPVNELQFLPLNRRQLIVKKRTNFEAWDLTSFKKIAQSDNMPFEIGGALLLEYSPLPGEVGDWEIIFTNRQSNIFLVIKNDLLKVSKLLADKNEPNPLDSLFEQGCNHLKLAPVKNKGLEPNIADFVIFSVGRRNTSLNIYTCSLK